MRRLSGCISRALIGAGDLSLDGGARRLPAFGQQGIESAADNAGIGFLSVANLAGVVNFFCSQADFANGRDILVGNIPFALPAMALDFAPILRRVVLIGEAPLGV